MKTYPRILLEETGNNLVSIMKEKNITVKDLQDIFGFENPQAIYKWRRGECLPTIDNLIILASVLNVKIEQLLIIDK